MRYLFAFSEAFARALVFLAAGFLAGLGLTRETDFLAVRLFAGLEPALEAVFPADFLFGASFFFEGESLGCLARSARMISS